MKIVVLDGYTLNPGDISWEEMERLGELTVYDRTPQELIAERIGRAEIVFTNKTPLTEDTMQRCGGMKYIGVLATGYNVVDIEAAKERSICVTNIPSYGTDAVGQFAIGLLLEICHRIGHHNQAVQEGRWEKSADWCFWDYPLIELAGKTMGVIGFGRIGQSTGRLAKALGMKVIAYDAHRSEAGAQIAGYVELDELLQTSDVISLHCPLLPSTERIIRKENIEKMKDGVIILNNARGGLIAEQDLADALKSKKVYAAGLDVVSTEPVTADNPLLHLDNCIITPHISWAPKESRMRLLHIAVKNLAAYMEGKPENVVNA